VSEDAVSDPCIGVCQDFRGICMGCGRTTEEIDQWSQVDEAERKNIDARARKRRRWRLYYLVRAIFTTRPVHY